MSDVRSPGQFKRLYHGTSAGRAEKIAQEGLRPGQGPSQVHSVSASEDPREAWVYAGEKKGEDARAGITGRALRPVLVSFDDPGNAVEVSGSVHTFNSVIPPESIKVHDMTESRQLIEKVQKQK